MFGDGSVQFVKNQLTMNQVQALLSCAGGEYHQLRLLRRYPGMKKVAPMPDGGTGAGLCLVQRTITTIRCRAR